MQSTLKNIGRLGDLLVSSKSELDVFINILI